MRSLLRRVNKVARLCKRLLSFPRALSAANFSLPPFLSTGEKIRFRVIGESFVDTSPTGPKEASAVATDMAAVAAAAAATPETTEEKKIPYSLTASISEPGLGLLSWWS